MLDKKLNGVIIPGPFCQVGGGHDPRNGPLRPLDNGLKGRRTMLSIVKSRSWRAFPISYVYAYPSGKNIFIEPTKVRAVGCSKRGNIAERYLKYQSRTLVNREYSSRTHSTSAHVQHFPSSGTLESLASGGSPSSVLHLPAASIVCH